MAQVNEELLDAPQLLNESPYDAWMIKVEGITDQDELMSAEEYIAFYESQEG